MLRSRFPDAASPSPSLAAEPILLDLINSLLWENLFGFRDRAEPLSAAEIASFPDIDRQDTERLWRVWLAPGQHYLLMRLHPAILGGLQISHLPVWSVSLAAGSPDRRRVEAPEVFSMLAQAFPKAESLANLAGVLQALRVAIAQSHLSAPPAAISLRSFIDLERLSAWRDRPFHPTARAKVGWSDADYRRFSPELSTGFAVGWMAIRRDYVQTSQAAATTTIAEALLDQRSQAQLRAALAAAQLSESDYLALPVHPWQAQRVLPNGFAAEIAAQLCVPLPLTTGCYLPTSSLRSLAPAHASGPHLKLPLGIDSLGALRILPPRYLANGEQGQRLLRQVMHRHGWLQRRVYLADETRWWAFHAPGDTDFADRPGHLACLLRQYPPELLTDGQISLVPMAALAVKPWSQSVWSQWLQQRQLANDESSLLALWAEISRELCTTALVFARYGVMPELHGQNVVLVLRSGSLLGLLLRDHDTVRLHRPWLRAAGLEDPGYRLKPGTPNTLVLPTPEALLAYFLTLAVEVNLAAMIDTLCSLYPVTAAACWRVLRQSLSSGLEQAGFSSAHQAVVHRVLFEQPTWPFKHLLRPLLNRQGSGGGSMPSALGLIPNPFYPFEE